MALLIGTDEAGYGPNLGPLVITATAWRFSADSPAEGLGTRHDSRASLPDTGAHRIFGDSKRLYTPGGSLAALERGVWAVLARAEDVGTRGATWRQLLTRLDPSCVAAMAEYPWYADYDQPLPAAISLAEVHEAQAASHRALADVGLRFVTMRSRVVDARAFNERVTDCGSKGTALSQWTLELLRDVLEDTVDTAVFLQCDKHGGRNRYAALLQQFLAAAWVQVCGESREESVYRWEHSGRRYEARFTACGERFLPVALASMTSKYLRELAMAAFNRYWSGHVPGLRPTAGYPQDAARFRTEIRAKQQQLGVSDAILWRTR